MGFTSAFKGLKGAQFGRGDWCDWMQSCLRNGDTKARFTYSLLCVGA
jgi:hypothetical protein